MAVDGPPPRLTSASLVAASTRGRDHAPEAPDGVGTSHPAMRCAMFSDPDERVRSCLEHGHRREALEPVGAGWEHDGNSVFPSVAGAGVLHGESAVAQQCFDPPPLVSRRHPGPQVLPRLHARWAVLPRLREHGTSPQHAERTPGVRTPPNHRCARKESSAHTGRRRCLNGAAAWLRCRAVALSGFCPNPGRCPESGQIPDSFACDLAVLTSAQPLLPPTA
jgi:hypothetical protein